MDGANGESERIKSTDTLLSIVECMKEHRGGTVTELSNEVGVSNSTIHRHLMSLQRRGYVVKNGDRYNLSFKFLDLGSYVRHHRKGIRRIKPIVRKVAEDTGEVGSFMIEENGRGVCVYREMAGGGVNSGIRVGSRTPLHKTSNGKAILANVPHDQARDLVIAHYPNGEKIVSADGFMAELEEIREQGYAFDRSEYTDGILSVAVPVHTPNGGVLGALAVAGPSYRLDTDLLEEEFPEILLGIVREFELNLTHS